MAASRSLALALAYTLCLTLLLITASTPALLVQGHPHSKVTLIFHPLSRILDLDSLNKYPLPSLEC